MTSGLIVGKVPSTLSRHSIRLPYHCRFFWTSVVRWQEEEEQCVRKKGLVSSSSNSSMSSSISKSRSGTKSLTVVEKIKNKLRAKFVFEEDLNKRPSDAEIKKMGLPQNTPTIGERLRRDWDHAFFQKDPKHGYYKGPTGTIRDFIDPETTTKEMITEGFNIFKVELKKWRHELMRDSIENKPRLGESRVEYDFNTAEKFNDWVVTCDSTWGEGYSTATLKPHPSGLGYALFEGNLSTRVPKDGRTKRSGYVNMKAVNKRLAFFRLKTLGWEEFTHLLMKVRGDGRTYNINLHLYSEFDIAWNDLFTYPLHTRGGPYWQDVKIPLNKFIFGAHGKIQDSQNHVPLINVIALGITLNDRIDGPFSLEVDNISVLKDPTLVSIPDKTPYESYQYPSPGFTEN